MPANKKLGQHWLQDPLILQTIADYAKLNPSDFVVEVGPGLGTLTSKLLKSNANILAIEFDEKLASDLPKSFPGKTNLEVTNSDIRTFNFEELPKGYKLVTNLPYYISGLFFRNLIDIKNKPSLAVVLVQKEVAKKMSESPEIGNSNKLAMLLNFYYTTELGITVGKESFSPPPKVKSQVIVLEPRETPLFNLDFKRFSQLVKFSFASPRKTLVNNLSSGLRVSKQEVAELLKPLNLNPETRAEELSLEQWQDLFNLLNNL